jgi:Family of unknown function (DUF6494)
MDEDVFNMSIRKFLKKVGVTSQREIEQAVRDAIQAGSISEGQALKAKVVLSVPEVGLEVPIEGAIETK